MALNLLKRSEKAAGLANNISATEHDANLTAIENEVNAKADLFSPAFTGVPTAPTASPGTSTTQIATTAFVSTADATKASLNSPALTGTPTAPTATVGTNTTQVATTAFVIANAGSGGGAPLNSPAFTGTPTAPTATVGTNTTQIATTAFVLANAGSGGTPLTVQDEGSSLSTAASTLNFVGAGVVATGTSTTKTITIAGGSGTPVAASDLGIGLSVLQWGAVGDNTSRPVSQWFTGGARARGYANLAALQVDYPHVTSSTDEIDWAATQKCINVLAATTYGGTVLVPAGQFVCNKSLTFPLATDDPLACQVNMKGAGDMATRFRWTSDLGLGNFAVTITNRTADVDTRSAGQWEDFAIIGPNPSNTTGVSPCNMGGFGWSGRRNMVRCQARYFRVGIDIRGDHTMFYGCNFQFNYYGAYLSRPNPGFFGEFVFDRCSINGSAMANMAMAPSATLFGGVFTNCYFGGAPYSFLKEAGTTERTNGFINGCYFLNCMFEYTGNALMWDAHSTQDATVINTTFKLPFFSWDDGNLFTGTGNGTNGTNGVAHARRAIIDICRAENLRLEDVKDPYRWEPLGPTSTFHIEEIAGFYISGDVEQMLDKPQPATRNFLVCRNGDHGNVKIECQGRFRAIIAKCDTAITKGNVVERYFEDLRHAVSTSTSPVAGVAMMTGRIGDAIAVMVEGRFNVNRGTNTPALNQMAVKSTTAGMVTSSNTVTDPRQIVGWIKESFNSSFTDIGVAVRAPYG